MIASASGLPLADLGHLGALGTMEGAQKADLDAFTELTECKEKRAEGVFDRI